MDAITAQIGALADEANRLSLIDMSAGVPRFTAQTSRGLHDVNREWDDESTRYSPARGLVTLRDQLTKLYVKAGALTSHEVVVTCGATEAVAAAILALTEPGARIGYVEPHYPGYVQQVDAFHRTRVPIELPSFVDRTSATETLRASDVSMLVIANPANPTGRVLTPDQLVAVIESMKNQAFVVLDEVYSSFGGSPDVFPVLSLSSEAWKQTLRVHSASKLFGRPGWRVGWIAGDPEVLSRVEATHSSLVGCAPAEHQRAVASLLEAGLDPWKEAASLVTARARRFCDELAAMGVAVTAPAAGFHVRASSDRFRSSEEMQAALRDQCKVQSVPWSWFLSRDSETTPAVRLSVVADEDATATAIERIGALLGGWD